MNEIRRQRLQNQIFRHVATYYQKMSRGQDAQGLMLDTRSIDASSEGQDGQGLALDTRSIEVPTEAQDAHGLTLDTTSIQALTEAQDAQANPPPTSPFNTQNPFAQAEPHDFTHHMKDYCTFTRCELSADGSFAKIFVSIWGDEKEQERIMKDIKRHAHGMRSSIAKHIRMRVIPQLAFVQDHSFEKGAEVEKLIR